MDLIFVIFVVISVFVTGVCFGASCLQPKPTPTSPIVPGMTIINTDGTKSKAINLDGSKVLVRIESANGLYIERGNCDASAFWALYKEQEETRKAQFQRRQDLVNLGRQVERG